MAPRDQLEILQAIEAMLRGGLTEFDFARNDYTLADPGDVARINMFDGDPGAPVEELLGGRHKTYRHEIPLEIVPRQIDPTAELRVIHGRLRDLVAADRWLGGLVDDLDISEVATAPVPVSEAETLITGLVSLTAEYTL